MTWGKPEFVAIEKKGVALLRVMATHVQSLSAFTNGTLAHFVAPVPAMHSHGDHGEAFSFHIRSLPF